MLLTTPLFPGECSIDQLVEIVKILGTPSKKEIYKMNPESGDIGLPKLKKVD